MLLAQGHPTGQRTGAAHKVLRTRYLIIATLLFIILGYVFWKPLPFQLPWLLGMVISILGAGIFFASLYVYIWGLRTLGINFNASSGFGVRLHQAHQLVTSGPYAYVRHPMYMAVILAGWGGLALYRTWTMLFFAVIMLGLLFRGRKEEEALAQAFGTQWEIYDTAGSRLDPSPRSASSQGSKEHLMSYIIPGSEPFYLPGGSTGCLLLHGFSATPEEMRPLGEFLASKGYSVIGVRLAGHATHP